MAFNPKQEYVITEDKIRLKDFHEYKDYYVTRPPYQRKSVWSVKKQQSLIDSIFRRFYVPRLVIREVRLGDDRTVHEIIDGQQRITSIQNFFDNKFKLPKSLTDVHPELPNKYFNELIPELRMFIDKSLSISADVVKNIEDPKNQEHQKVATEIFWRLQQGETLNFMEIAHAKLSSLSRNFVVKYSDDITFDYASYKPIDSNKHKHPFFNIIDRANDRMQHLTLLTRFLIIEENEGYAELKDTQVVDMVKKYEVEDGIGNHSMEQKDFAKQALTNLSTLYELFKDDPIIKDGKGKVKELKREYLIVSLYMLVRHLKKHYVLNDHIKKAIYNFFIDFHERWKLASPEDSDIMTFSNNRQQSTSNLEIRDMIFRQLFFEYLSKNNFEILEKDQQRAFNEAQRIKIYRGGKGMCQECLAEGKSEREAQVPWAKFQADHIFPHSKGGQTIIENGQLLCDMHNMRKGAKVESLPQTKI